MRSSTVSLSILLILLAGCLADGPTDDDDVTGDDDDATGDDDDATGDDDDATGDDDDATGDDDDATGDDDDATGDIVVEAIAPGVTITAPNYGFELAVDGALVTVEGVASAAVTAVTWEVFEGPGVSTASGTASGTGTWTAADVPLQPGDNTIVITGTDGVTSTTDAIVVASTPGVALQSGLTLSREVWIVGEAVTIDVQVLADGVDAVDVGPVDAAGALTATWASLTEMDDGLWTGSFTADTTAATVHTVRAVATAGASEGATPPRTVTVREAWDSAEIENAFDLHHAALDAWANAGGDTDPEAAVAAAIAALTADPAIRSVHTRADLPGSLSYVIEPGIPFVLLDSPPGSRGPATPAPGSTYSTGRLRAHTLSSAGIAGRPPRSTATGLVSTGRTAAGRSDAVVLAAFSDQFTQDEGSAVHGRFAGNSCPKVDSTPTYAPNVSLADVQDQFQAGLQQLSSHGAMYVKNRDDWWLMQEQADALVGLFTREEPPPPGNWPPVFDALLDDDQLIVGGAPARPGLGTLSEDFVVWLPRHVIRHRVGYPMPESVVVASTCYSLFNDTMAAAYLRAGASAFIGYTHVVNSTYAAPRTEEFWQQFLARDTVGEAFDEMLDPPTPDDTATPAIPAMEGNRDVALATSLPQDLEFDGTGAWTTGGSGTSQFSSSAAYAPLEAPASGSALQGHIQNVGGTTTTMVSAEQPFCPLPGEIVSGTVSWQVAVDPYLGWATFQDNRLILRADLADGTVLSDLLLVADWVEVSYAIGSNQSTPDTTGWQSSTFNLTIPMTGSPVDGLTFASFGWDANHWWFGVDAMTVSLSDQ